MVEVMRSVAEQRTEPVLRAPPRRRPLSAFWGGDGVPAR